MVPFRAARERDRLGEPAVGLHHQHSHTRPLAGLVCPADSGGPLLPGCQVPSDSWVIVPVTVLSPATR